jgi:hypothetical protein
MCYYVYNQTSSDQFFLGNSRRKAGRLLHHHLPYLQNYLVNTTHNCGDLSLPEPAHKSVSPNIKKLLNIDEYQGKCNPILSATDVTDFGDVDFVADPFILPDKAGQWHMFFEVFNASLSPDAAIGHAVWSNGGWEYNKIVLKTEFHLSFPYVFKWKDDVFMMPEQNNPDSNGTVLLYRAKKFPETWTETAKLIESDIWTGDPILFHWDGRWWLFVDDVTDPGSLYAFHNKSLETDEWIPHRKNPIVTDRITAGRPGGRPVMTDDRLLVFFQDQSGVYGSCVRVYEVTKLGPNKYNDRELQSSPILEPSDCTIGWNSGRMHHIDPWYVDGTWICVVDGNIGFGSSVFTTRNWSIGMYF